MMSKLVLILCFVLIFVKVNSIEIAYKVCSNNPGDSPCQQIARSGEIACNYNFHNVDCLMNIQQNQSHLGRISGEDAMLAANLISEDVVVLGEISDRNVPFETVVIVRTDIPDGFTNLRGKKLCHPGYNHDASIPHFLIQELENKIVEIENPLCDDNVTLVERHVMTLSEFFNETCRPGEWVQSTRFDQKLKEKYNSLCKLCNTDGNCDEDYLNPFRDSLNCLTQRNGDIAVTTLKEAKWFFNTQAYQQNYKYLCKNGTSKSHTAPCVWSTKINDLVVTSRQSASKVEKFLVDNLKSKISTTKQTTSLQDTYKDALTLILKLAKMENITLLDSSNYKSLKTYVTEKMDISEPQEKKQCDRTMKWCTYSENEQEKCKWLSQASANWGIQPIVECVNSAVNFELNCLEEIKKGAADLVVASSDYAYVSLKKNLRSVAFPETDTRNLSTILIVKRADNTDIKSIHDLKSKRACIPRFGGREHLAFIQICRDLGVVTNTQDACDYGRILSDLLGESCTPGVRSSLVKESTEYVDADKLCKLCTATEPTATAEFCNDDPINKYYDSAGALDCLRDNKADFAVITRKQFIENNSTEFKVICKNNTVSSISGLQVDDECALAILPNSEVLVDQDNIKIRDIKIALFEFEKWFGQNLMKSFHLFDRFNNTQNLLFLDSTPGLNIDKDVSYITEYKRLLQNVKTCSRTSDGYSLTLSVFVALVTIMSIFVNL